MKKWILLLGCLLLFLPMANAGEISYVGSSTVGKFMHDAEKVYDKSDFTINTALESGGGENAVVAGKAMLGGVAREVKPSILTKGVKKYLIGKDAIGVLVNAENPVENLSFDELKGIFTGQITNWQEVGGHDLPIKVFIVNPYSATRKVFKATVLGDAEYAGKNLRTIKPDTAILDKVASDAGAIGQLSFALSAGAEGVKKIKVNNEEPTVNNPNYPITRPLYLITKGEASGEVKDFIDWARSSAGQEIIKKNFVGI